MAKDSHIQWTTHTHNFWEGCHKVSLGCRNCYAERMFARWKKDFSQVRRVKGFDKPLSWKEPALVFTCSTSDFFIKEADAWRFDAYEVIRRSPHLIYQILTKRSERIHDNQPLVWYDNVWLGVSVEDDKVLYRVYDLINSGAKTKFLSIEPLIGPIANLPLAGIDWVIIGGESGNDSGPHRYRECKLEWIESIIAQSQAAGVPVFVKQLGTHLAKELNLRDRSGGDISEWPSHLQIREFPKSYKQQDLLSETEPQPINSLFP